jgi:peptide/nickel transport system substrate-binding protein
MLSVESLTQLATDGRTVPKLAESWWWEKNGRQLNVNLRPGIEFHDGTPLTADLAAKILGDAVARPSNRALFTSLSDVTAVRSSGERQVIFDLSQPSAFLPEDLELPLTHGTPAVGTGPYRIAKNDPAEVVLERFQKYYLGTPNIARVVIKPFDTLRTAWTSLLRNDVDMVTDVPPDAVEFIRNDDVRVVSFGRRYQYLVAFNSARAPFNSPIVRRALNMAIDRDALIQNVLQGHGLPSTGPLWPKNWAYDTSKASYRFDPGLAVSLLNSAGLHADKKTTGPQARLRFTCLIPENFSVIERVALEVQKQLYNVGVDMQFEVIPIKDFDARVREGRFEAILIDMISGPTVARSYFLWRSVHRLPRAVYVFGYENPETERLFDVMRTSTNEIATQSAFTRLQEVLLDDPPALFLTWNERSRAVRRDFQIVQDPRRDPEDPVYTIWRWTAAPEPRLALAQ